MFSLMLQKKVLAQGSYQEVRRKAFLIKNHSGKSLMICKRVITDTGVDLGWDEIGSIRVML